MDFDHDEHGGITDQPTCVDCGKPVDPDDSFQAFSGWKLASRDDGLVDSTVEGREWLDEWLCEECMAVRKTQIGRWLHGLP
jgi:hypothetical protein